MSLTRSKPNILVFMPDQMQAMVTFPGHPCKTPHIDRIRQEGVQFSHVYPPMAHCCPARASFMTGLFPSQHGVYNNVLNDQAIHPSLNPGVEMFSEKLRDEGYNLYYTGKWHVSATEGPCDRGWEELLLKKNETEKGVRRNKYRELAVEDPASRGRGEIVRPGWKRFRLYGTSSQTYEQTADYKYVQSAIRKLDEMQRDSEPWCMYIGPSGPHDPFVVPEKYANMYNADEIELPPNYEDDLRDKPRIYQRMRQVFAQLTEREAKEAIAHYWGFCTMIDDLFGEVLEALERNGQSDNTVIVFVSDHGEHLGAHGIYYKGISMFDEGYRVPLIVRAPGIVRTPGRIVDEFVTLMDIAPTLIGLAGAQPLDKCAGSSLIPFLRGETPQTWRDSVYAQCNGTELYYTSRMVKTKTVKFVYNPTDFDELYDLENDPHELTNIADRPENAETIKRMYAKMWSHAFASEDTTFVAYAPVTTGQYGPGIVNAIVKP